MTGKINTFGVFFVLCLWATTGCHTTQVPLEDATLTPPARLLAFQSKSPDYPSTLTIIRDTGMVGPSCYIMVYINNELAGRMDEGEKAMFSVPAGHTILMVRPDIQGEGFCWLAQGSIDQIETYLSAQETNLFRISGTPAALLKISQEEGQN